MSEQDLEKDREDMIRKIMDQYDISGLVHYFMVHGVYAELDDFRIKQ